MALQTVDHTLTDYIRIYTHVIANTQVHLYSLTQIRSLADDTHAVDHAHTH